MKSANLLLATVALLALGACGKNSGQKAQQFIDQTKHAADNKVAEANFATGTWKSNCIGTPVGLIFFGKTENIQYSASALGISRVTTFYSNPDCTAPNAKIEEKGNYSGWDLQASGNYNVNIVWQDVVVTPLNDATSSEMNTLTGYCNAKDWATNTPKDVTQQTNSTVLPPCFDKTPRNQYDLVQITGPSSNIMRLGMNANGRDKSTEAARPTLIDQSVTYTK